MRLQGRRKWERACGGADILPGVLRRALPAVTVFSMASPGADDSVLTGRCWEQAGSQPALCLTPGEKESQIRAPF